MNSKICGIKNKTILNYILSHPYPPKLVGFICNYKKSSRFIELDKLKKLLQTKKKFSKYVAVLVKPTHRELKELSGLPFDYFQIYGMKLNEIKLIKKKYKQKIIVAITIGKKSDTRKYLKYLNYSSIILFDSKGYEKSLSFNHSYLKNLPSRLNFMVAGNFKPNDDFKIFKKQFKYIDISGGVESKNGIKDKIKINQFLVNIKNTNDQD